jgi:septin 7
LTVVEAHGFGEALNNEESCRPIVDNIESRYDAYLEREFRVKRENIKDTRVHACLYFINPTGHSLSALDIEFMKKLSPRVNIIPVIAKADTLTEEDLAAFKSRVSLFGVGGYFKFSLTPFRSPKN